VVTGTVILNATDTAATSFTVDTNTGNSFGSFGLGQYVPASPNSFTVASGQITFANFFKVGGGNGSCCSITLDFNDPFFGTFAGLENGTGGIVNFNPSSGLTFTPVVPLPGALPLFATGLAGLGLLGWRRKKAAAG
jgi:hypothetical protein